MLGSLFARAQRGSTSISSRSTARAALLLLPLGVVTLFACADDGNTTDNNPSVGAIAGGAQGGAAPGGGAAAGAGTPGAGTPGAGAAAGGAASGGVTGGAPTGGTPAGTAAAGGTPGAGQPGAAGGGAMDAGAPGGTTGGAPDGGATGGGDGGPSTDGLKAKCMGGEQMGCSSFVTAAGKEIVLGPYGAAMDVNVGAGFENAVSPSDNYDDCKSFAASFGQDPAQTEALLDLKGGDLKLYSVYRPAAWKAGEKYPIITWGNGTCAQPEGYGALLRFVASHGFVIFAANSRYVGSNDAMKHALDFAFKANDDAQSPYYQKLDTMKVGAMGHSQGSQATAAVASDARVKVVILFNGGSTASKPFLAVTGDRDIPLFGPSVATLKSAIAAAPKAAYLFYHMVPMNGQLVDLSGHLTLMTQPERVTDATAQWWKLMLNNDGSAKEWFVGASCKLCGKAADFEFGQKGLE
jgi:hypothetical protein